MKFLNSYNILDKIISFIRNYELLKDKRLNGKSIIDFGCGSDFEAISKRYTETSKAVLIDLYGDDFTKNKIKFINYNNNLNKIDIELKNEKFDIIILAAVIEHLDNPEVIIKYLKKFLNKNGYFLLTAPSIYSKPILEFMAFKLNIINADLVKEHKRYYNKNEYIDLAKKTESNLINFKYFLLGMNTIAILK
jgi:2-polyprenyl-3-methyl-5-hydroxy-6-metoxy-1,4-benzoquinol methylase